MSSRSPAIRGGKWRGVESSLADKEAHAMNAAVAETQKPIQQELRYHLPRWMVVFVVIALIPQR
jgi:hypothetical protein